ncbi:Diacylglycerol kinase [Caulifigura coniformis]|uniref:Diacylglycerol kinase n=1 Tax=Caulifigura coniformis TaxID=2527983 RepID=A0A517S9S5_9PLAN|nr:diacylglycerol kinase family protein [Caulifigura coniformis]QDT52871.1 Diacylglycerol kinase [Caulifigura coniformis]
MSDFSEIAANSAPWVAIQRNPSSGSGKGARQLLRLIRALKKHGLRPRLFSRRADLEAAVRNPLRRPALRAIVAAGGDGTVIDVVNRFPGHPIAVLPLGTENLFARALGLTCDGERLAGIIAAGTVSRFDCARANGRRFLVVASTGFDAEVIHLAHARRTGRIRRWFYALPITTALARYPFPPVTVQFDDDPTPHTACLVLVANLSRYALGLPIAPHASGHDGLLDVCLFQCPGRWRLFRDLMAVLRGTHLKERHVVMRQAKRIVIAGEQPVCVQIDGDPAGQIPVTIEIEPSAIEVFTPGEVQSPVRNN